MLILALILLCPIWGELEQTSHGQMDRADLVYLLPIDHAPEDPYWQYYQDCDRWEIKFVELSSTLVDVSKATSGSSPATPATPFRMSSFSVPAVRNLESSSELANGVLRREWGDVRHWTFHQHQWNLSREIFRFIAGQTNLRQDQWFGVYQHSKRLYFSELQPIFWQAEQFALQRQAKQQFYLVPSHLGARLVRELNAYIFSLSEKANGFLPPLSTDTTLFHATKGSTQVAN